VGIAGRGWPKAIQNKKESAVRAPIIAPFSVAISVPIPRVKTPNSGPPITPKMVKPAYEEEKFWMTKRIKRERYDNNNKGTMRNSFHSINFLLSNLLATRRPIIVPEMPERWKSYRT